MKLGIRKGFSSVWHSEDQIRALLPAIASAGFDGIEPTFLDDAVPSPQGYRREARMLLGFASDLGLAIPSMRGGSGFWDTIPSPDARERKRAVELVERALDCLAIMDGTTLLVVPGRSTAEVGYPDHWSRVIEFAVRAGELAEERGITIALENVEARFPLSSRDWEALLRQIDHPKIRIYLDVGNVLWLGLGYPQQWIRSLGPWIASIHFKDALFGSAIRPLLEGEVDWPAVVQALLDIGYSGWINVEPEWYRFAPWRLPARLSADLDAILAFAERQG